MLYELQNGFELVNVSRKVPVEPAISVDGDDEVDDDDCCCMATAAAAAGNHDRVLHDM